MSRYLVLGLSSATGSACGQVSTPVFVQLDVLTLVRHVPCLIIVISISNKWGYAHAVQRWLSRTWRDRLLGAGAGASLNLVALWLVLVSTAAATVILCT